MKFIAVATKPNLANVSAEPLKVAVLNKSVKLFIPCSPLVAIAVRGNKDNIKMTANIPAIKKSDFFAGFLSALSNTLLSIF
jgi:hypothetical protein